ncbi:MAG TPA: hypothetical protein VJV78_11940 [Polyangiales bacterium]|nr:hypothetical protein [Polyangiales bacterium]
MSQWAPARANIEFGLARIIEVEAATCCAGAWANISLTRWVGRGTAAAVDKVSRVGDEVRTQYPSGVSAIHLIAETAGMPTPEAREGLVKLMNRKTERLGCVGVVVGGSGFWASAIRSLVTGMRAVSSRAYELKLAGSIDEIVAWFPDQHAKRTGIAIDPDELAKALRTANEWRADADD